MRRRLLKLLLTPQPAQAQPGTLGNPANLTATPGPGIVQCWGANGDADKGQANPPPGAFTAISASYYHSCGVLTGGRVMCWGNNESGQAAPP